MTDGIHRPAREMSLTALFLKFLGFGLMAFGGPVAQIAMVKKALVEDGHWIEPARFNRLLAVLQILPGPEAHELCVHLGIVARGRLGGLLAGLGFMLPGFVLMLVAGWLYVSLIAGRDDLSGILLGIQIAVLAIILRAVVRIGQHILENRLLWLVAVASLIATVIGVPFWIPLILGGLGYAVSHRPLAIALVAASAAGLSVAFLMTPDVAASGHGMPRAPVTLLALFVAGLKGGLLTFGGAYTAIPYVRADTVGRNWISDATFLDGIALAGVLPAPLVIFATFVGYVTSGIGGACAITAGMFLPAFAFSLVFYERLEAIVENPALHHVLDGVAAAVVGIIAATFLQLGEATVTRVPDRLVAVTVFSVALCTVWRLKGLWVTPFVLAAGGMGGWLFIG